MTLDNPVPRHVTQLEERVLALKNAALVEVGLLVYAFGTEFRYVISGTFDGRFYVQ